MQDPPLFERLSEIEKPNAFTDFSEIFGINTKNTLKEEIKKLNKLNMTYHTDKCSKEYNYSDSQVEKCNVISKKIQEIVKKLTTDGNFDSVLRLPLPESVYNLDLDLLSKKIPDINVDKEFYTALLTYDKILSLAFSVFIALQQKFSDLPFSQDSQDNKEYYLNTLVTIIASNITLSFFEDDYDFDALLQQILSFIEKIEVVDDTTYKLHDIIDLQGKDRDKLGNDYCIALSIFYKVMKTFFDTKIKEPSNFLEKVKSSFYTHKQKCTENISYSPEPSQGKFVKSTRVFPSDKLPKNFDDCQLELNRNFLGLESIDSALKAFREKLYITPYYKMFKDTNFSPTTSPHPGPVPSQPYNDGDELPLVPYVASGGSKSRRRHRRNRKSKPMRKTRRIRGRTRKSKSKRQIRARKHKKNTYKRCK